jgi:hypothetical protein
MIRKYICKICGNNECEVVLKLTDTPLGDQFIREKMSQPNYPLDVALCEGCGYLFLPYLASPDESYSDYLYHSSVTVGLNEHYDKYAEELIKEYGILENALVVDLGSNDGSMLSSFKKRNMRVIGVEPAKLIADFANRSGLPTLCGFFNEKLACHINDEYGKASVITANYMFANIDDFASFCQSVEMVLDDEGIFVIQTGYHLRQFENLMFDYIYHEHFSYFSIKSLIKLLGKYGLQIIDVKEVSPKGGSIRVVAKKKIGKKNISANLGALLDQESSKGIYSKKYFVELQEKIEKAKNILLNYLDGLRNKRIKIIGFGASHSTTTLLYHFDLGKYIDYIVDDNLAKQNTYSPGLQIRVLNPDVVNNESNPIAIVILAWQHAESIMNRHNKLLTSGNEFVIPLPNLKIKKLNE